MARITGTRRADRLTGSADDDQLYGLGGRDVLQGHDGDDLLDGGAGIDTLIGGAGNDTYVVNSRRDLVIEYADAGIDTVLAAVSHTLGANVENLILTGTAAIDAAGNGLANTLVGNAAANVLDGGAGDDTLAGGYGDDSYVLGSGGGSDVIVEVADTYAGAGTDTIRIGGGILPAAVSLIRTAAVDGDLIVRVDASGDQITVAGQFSGNGAVERIEFANGVVWDAAAIAAAAVFDQGMGGSDGDDILLGTPAADTLDGGAGNDQLWGGGAADLLIGGSGDDIFFVDAAGDVVSEAAAAGRDSVHAAVTTLLAANVENLLLAGTAAIDATGNALANVVFGNAGANSIDGGAGNDVLNGRGGDDTYLFGYGSGHDVIDVNNQQYLDDDHGHDRLQLGAGIGVADVGVRRVDDDVVLTLNGSGETLTLANRSFEEVDVRFADGTVWGSELLGSMQRAEAAQSLTGTDAGDYLYGGSGNDTLVGLGAYDRLFGGEGDDLIDVGIGGGTAIGHTGSDSYVFGRDYGYFTIYEERRFSTEVDRIRLLPGIAPGDVVFTRDGNTNLRIGLAGSSDQIWVSGHFADAAHAVERLVFADGAEVDLTALALPVLGTRYADILVGGYGADTFDGGVDQTQYPQWPDHLNSCGGADTVVFGRGYGRDIFTHTSWPGTAATAAPGPVSVQLGADLAPGAVTLVRSPHHLYLSIDGGADLLTLPYAAGSAGNVESIAFADGTVWGAAAFEAVPLGALSLSGSAGNDYLLGAADGDLIGGGGGDDYLDGGEGADVIDGGNGRDHLLAGSGNDTLDGGAGDDDYWVGGGSNRILFGPGAGHDVVHDAAYGDGFSTDDLLTVALAAGATAAFERSGADLVVRVSASDSLTVRDYFASYAAGNVVVDVGGARFGTAELYGATGSPYAVPLTGTEGNDFPFWGSARADVMDGLGGDDYLDGSGGDDTIDGGAGNDMLGGGAGADLLRGGDGDDYLSGDGGAGTLDGGGGNDVLGGGADSDVFVFGRGYGIDQIQDRDTSAAEVDVIRMQPGIAAADLVMEIAGPEGEGVWSNMALSIAVAATGDRLVVSDWLARPGSSGYTTAIARIEFADGSSLALDGSAGPIAPIVGSDESERIDGTAGADLIDARGGFDYLRGGRGDDVYVLAPGGGDDLVIDGDGTLGNVDTIRVAGGVLASQVSLFRDAASLYLQLDGSVDRMRVVGFFASPDNRLERIEFAADGSVWDLATLAAAPLGATPAIVGRAAQDDDIDGTDYADVIDGRGGRDILRGGLGNDVYLYGRGYGDDDIEEYDPTPGNVDTIRFAADVAAADVYFSRDSRGPLVMRIRGDVNPDSGSLFELRAWDHFDGARYQIERVEFAGGGVVELAELGLVPFYDQSAVGSAGNDLMQREPEEFGYGDWYEFDGAAGNDLVQSLGVGGALAGGAGNDLLIGGAGDNRIDAGGGADVLCFNRGDGLDTLAPTAAGAGGDTLSLGGGIGYADLALRRVDANLVLETGNGEGISFEGWYADGATHGVDRLQVIVAAMADYYAGSADTLLASKVQGFDFGGLAQRFDQVLAADPALGSWSLAGALRDFQLGGSDTAAFGGDLAYRYGSDGALSGMAATAAHAVLAAPAFGAAAQTWQPAAAPQPGLVLLA